MKLIQQFTLSNQLPQPGGSAAIWLHLKPQEVVDAETAGSGAGVPDANGKPTPGTIVPGMLCYLNSSGNADKAVQKTAGTDFAVLYLVAFAGDDDFSGSLGAELPFFHGGARFDTESFDNVAYTIGTPLVPSSGTAGNFAPKGAANDNIIAVGFVGPRGVSAAPGKTNYSSVGGNVLDVVMPQGSGI